MILSLCCCTSKNSDNLYKYSEITYGLNKKTKLIKSSFNLDRRDLINKLDSYKFIKYTGGLGNTAVEDIYMYGKGNRLLFTLRVVGNKNISIIKKGRKEHRYQYIEQ